MASLDTLVIIEPLAARFPTSNPAAPGVRNACPTLDFDASTEQTCHFGIALPHNYAAGGINVEIYWMAASATSGDVKWGVAVERRNANNHDLDADAFATEQTATGTANGTSGKITKTTVAISNGANLDSAAAGDPIRIKVARKAADAADTMTGSAQVDRVIVAEQ